MLWEALIGFLSRGSLDRSFGSSAGFCGEQMAGWSPEEGEAVFYRHLHGTVYPALPAAAWMSISLTASFLLFRSCILPGQIYIHIHRGGDLEMFVEKWNLKISSFFCRKHSMQL